MKRKHFSKLSLTMEKNVGPRVISMSLKCSTLIVYGFTENIHKISSYCKNA